MVFIAPIVGLSGVGMGDFERGWVVTKRIKYGHCAKLIGMKTDKISIISTTIKLNKARTKREEL